MICSELFLGDVCSVHLPAVCEVPNRCVSAVVTFELLLQLCEPLSELIDVTCGKLFVSAGWQFQ